MVILYNRKVPIPQLMAPKICRRHKLTVTLIAVANFCYDRANQNSPTRVLKKHSCAFFSICPFTPFPFHFYSCRRPRVIFFVGLTTVYKLLSFFTLI